MNETNRKNGKRKFPLIRLIIIAVVIILVIVLLVRCVGSCGRNAESLLNEALLNNPEHYTSYSYSGSGTFNNGDLDTTIAPGVPEKRTQILGNGQDVATVMVYICGSDLESEGGAATMDIKEMLNAGVGENVNLILYTGGTNDWQNRQMSSRVNQVYQISGNSLYRLVEDAGNKNMADPDTLSDFIQFCGKNFPANRNMLILWDHGGGSVSGFGYDEKYKREAGMDLSEIRKALNKGGVEFDFIGFDACLMGSVESGFAVSDYADYLIGSEESESGYGWYYTDWLRMLSDNTSVPTIELGKRIVDDFVSSSSGSFGRSQPATLSVTDLAELSYTVPDKLRSFASSVTDLIENETSSGSYKTVSYARSNARSFGVSNGVDQVDLVDFAKQLDNPEGVSLAEAVLGAVKYNNTSRDMTASYGLSIYFPYSSSKYVGPAEQVYSNIGISKEYTRCVQTYAAVGLSGQYISGGSGDPFNSLFGIFGEGNYGSGSYYGNSSGSSYSSDSIYDMLGDLMGGSLGGFSSDYDSYDFSFFRNIDLQKTADFLAENQFDERALKWQKNAEGRSVIRLSGDQWSLVRSIELNMFYDDGEGLIDLGKDNVLEFDKEGSLLGENDGTWLTIDGNYISYFYDSMTTDGDRYTIKGHSPVLYNGIEADLLLTFDEQHPYGYIAGVRFAETEDDRMIGKTLESVKIGEKTDLETGEEVSDVQAIHEGDQIEFLADFYDYQGNFLDRYTLGDAWIVGSEEAVIGNMDLGEGSSKAMYCFTDIYQKQYWTEVIPE